jgi:hypothetical protein
MSDSNFQVDEMRLMAISFFALILIQFLFFTTGVFAQEYTNDPPEFNSSNQTLIEADRPAPPGSSSAQNGTKRTFNVSVSTNGDCAGLDKDWFGNPLELCLDSHQTNPDQATIYLNDNENNEQTSDYTFSVGDTKEIDGLTNYNTTIELDRCQYCDQGEEEVWYFDAVVIEFGTNSSGGFFGGLVYLAETIGWAAAFFIGLVFDIVLLVIDIASFTLAIGGYLIGGWVRINGELGQVSPFLPLIVTGVQLPLYFLAFNGVAKIIKMIPTT